MRNLYLWGVQFADEDEGPTGEVTVVARTLAKAASLALIVVNDIRGVSGEEPLSADDCVNVRRREEVAMAEGGEA